MRRKPHVAMGAWLGRKSQKCKIVKACYFQGWVLIPGPSLQRVTHKEHSRDKNFRVRRKFEVIKHNDLIV